MAQPLALTLLEEGAVSASASGDALDISASRSAMQVAARVTAVGAGGITIYLDTSADGSSNWKQVGQVQSTVARDVELTVGGLRRYVRARWALAAGAAGIVAGITATAHQLYCSPEDMARYGLPDDMIDGLTESTSDRIDACLAATDEAEGYLATRYDMPLSSWSFALRLHCAKLAIVSFLDGAGWQPDGPDTVIMGGYTRAIAWLKGVASGAINPPGIVDATPATSSTSAAHVSSQTPRGW